VTDINELLKILMKKRDQISPKMTKKLRDPMFNDGYWAGVYSAFWLVEQLELEKKKAVKL